MTKLRSASGCIGQWFYRHNDPYTIDLRDVFSRDESKGVIVTGMVCDGFPQPI